MADKTKSLYPHFSVENNKKPNKLLNFPFFGILIKVIILIPVWIEAFFLGIAAFFVLMANWFVISFTGRYWDVAYRFFVGLMKFWIKIRLYMFGITDKYPGFNLNTNGLFEFDIPKPENPNKWLAIPLLGLIVRLILLIPYCIFSDVLQRGANFAMFLSWFVILFKGRLPETIYEFERDSLRVNYAANAYVVGLSDKYPSFYISMNHQTAKILLIIVGAIFSAFNMLGSLTSDQKSTYDTKDYQYQYEYGPDSNVKIDYQTY
jgi:hypothetical protein